MIRAPDLPAAMTDQFFEPRREAVAPVTRRVGAYGEEAEVVERRRGRVVWANVKRPRLEG